jgi:hypothetical protein
VSDVNRSLAESRDALDQLIAAGVRSGGRTRLLRAHDVFDRACRECGARFDHGIFGTISTADDARFQALHPRHHTKQITGQ